MKSIERSKIMEFCGEIVDIFEDYAESHGIMITNNEVEAEIDEDMATGEYKTRKEARDINGYALLYGDDYDAIADDIEGLFYSPEDDGFGDGRIPEVDETKLQEVSERACNAFSNIAGRNGAVIPKDHKQMLIDKVKKTFAAWRFIGNKEA